MFHFVNIHFVPIVNPNVGAVNAREGYFTQKPAGELLAARGRARRAEAAAQDGFARCSMGTPQAPDASAVR